MQKLKVSSYFIFGLSYGLGFPESQELDFLIIDRIAGRFNLIETPEYRIAKRNYRRKQLFKMLCDKAEEYCYKKRLR